MNLLHYLRNTPWLASLALLWFAVTLGVAAASPLLQPQNEAVICTGVGMLKVVLADDGTVTPSGVDEAVFCPLCMVGGAAPPAELGTVRTPLAPQYVFPGMPAPRVLVLTASPPPLRGPPSA